jgi:hypothetical protein
LKNGSNSWKETNHKKMRNLKKRIEALEAQEAQRYTDANCICHRYGAAMFHTNEEYEGAKKIPCPIHGYRRWKFAFIGVLRITEPLEPAERHLCHCPPMLQRTIMEEGRDLTPEEWKAAQQQYEDWWTEDIKSRNPAAR